MKQKKIFTDQLIVITGAAGFIGSGVISYLNSKGMDNLLLVDNFKDSDKWKNIVGKKFVDIVSPENLFSYLEGREREIEAFIHLGACADTLNKNADYMLDTNYRFSKDLAEYALDNDHRFIYASSAATYGDGSQGFSDEENDLYSLNPLNIYAYSKHLFDLWLKNEGILDKVVGLKYFNVFGPNENHKGHMASMVYKMYQKLQTQDSIELFKSTDDKYKDGDQQRDFIYVKDAARMTCQLLDDAFKDVSGIFNIGRGVATTWNQVAKALFSALEKKENIRYVDMPLSLSKQYQNYTCADMTKYQKVHNFQGEIPTTLSIENAVKDYVQNYLIPDKRW